MANSDDSLEEGEILEEGELPAEVTGPPPRSHPRTQHPPHYREERPARRGDRLPPPPLPLREARDGWSHGRPHDRRHSFPLGDRGAPAFRHGPPLPPYQPPPPPLERGSGRQHRRPSPPPPALPPSPLPPSRTVSPPPRQLAAEELAARDAREMEALAADVTALARTLTLQACLKDLGRVCSDLAAALRKTAAYVRLLKQQDETSTGADSSEVAAQLGGKLLGALKALHVYSNTGQGRDMGAHARGPVQAAWHAQDEIFTAAQRSQLAGLASSSKNFAALLEDGAAQPQPVRRDYVPAPRQQPQQKEKKRRAPDQEVAPLVPAPHVSKRQLKRAQAQQRAEEEAAARAAAKQLAEQLAAQAAAGGAASQAADAAEPAGKQFRLTIKLGTSSLGAGEAPEPWQQQQLPGAAHQHEANDEEAPPLPPDEPEGGGWQSVTVPPPVLPGGWGVAGELPVSPMSSPTSPRGSSGAGAANGSWQAAQLELNPSAVKQAADGSREIEELLGQGKLCLVLDLDHTLLNSATFGEVGPVLHQALELRAATEAETLPQHERLLFRMDGIKMWTKLRPGVHKFLHRAARTYQLWIHTNGNRAYADSVVRLLDPQGLLFGERIIAQGADRLDQMVPDQAKRLMQGLDEREAITVIVDDSHSVWAQHRHNLVAVERYVYFPSSRTSLGLKGPSLLDANRDECSDQGMLMVALDVLMRVHGAVMRALGSPPQLLPSGEAVARGWDVRHALTQEREKVLAGVRLVFTRVIPLEMDAADHPLWRLAESYGATCSGALDASTTHVIAGASGTEKVLTARGMGKWVVTPAWLECSCILWKRAREERFLVPP
ncbi:hypothetical protein D9Q98_003136 [Chlorella vulgaris]|uniref:protein-serine/threonine phosphatase n=1 Tax=Chlorella vulgaris TaxID=3077 RepID=A0A9D4TS07_CHLVU|nr:hypothetical protein D9Q98_003136 [Chlorella vulgaris]